jgi:hypothetical protein
MRDISRTNASPPELLGLSQARDAGPPRAELLRRINRMSTVLLGNVSRFIEKLQYRMASLV